MTEEQREEMASLYVLELLEPAERREFEETLRQDSDLQALVDDLRRTTAQLSLAAPPRQPPAQLRQATLDAIRNLEKSEDTKVTPLPPQSGNPFLRLLPLAASLILLVAAGVLFSNNQELRQKLETRLAELAEARNEVALVNRQLDQAMAQVAALEQRDDLNRLRIASLETQVESYLESAAVVVWDGEAQRGVLQVDRLPAPEPGLDYQLWVIDPAYENPVNAGVFNVGADGAARFFFEPDSPIHQLDMLAVSVEREGGVPKAEGPIVLTGK